LAGYRGIFDNFAGSVLPMSFEIAYAKRMGGEVGIATQRCWIYAEAMGPRVTRDAVIALVISIVATAALVSLGVV
jgi:hypothetical protein